MHTLYKGVDIMPREKKERPRKVYEVVNIHPTYATPEEREKAFDNLAYDLFHMFRRAQLEGRLYKKTGA